MTTYHKKIFRDQYSVIAEISTPMQITVLGTPTTTRIVVVTKRFTHWFGEPKQKHWDKATKWADNQMALIESNTKEDKVTV